MKANFATMAGVALACCCPCAAGGRWAGLYDFAVFSGGTLLSRHKPATASSVRGAGFEPGRAVDAYDGPWISDFVEGAYMIKRNGIYCLLYSSGVLHDGTYNVRYAMARHPLGPFTTPPGHVILQSNAEQTTRGPGHNSVLAFQGRHYIVYHQHNQPHENGGGVFRQTCADLLEFNPDGTIRPVVPTQTGVGALLPLVPRGTDVARGKYARATSVRRATYSPSYALDHNHAIKWRAVDNTYPQTLTVDLDGRFEIERVETSFEYPTLSYAYAIETSLDGERWQMYADRTAAFSPAVSPRVDTGNATAAFVRITITGCERSENGARIYTFKVFRRETP